MRVFLLAFLAGVVAAMLLAQLFPYPGQVRERSLSGALPNGGRLETFHIDLPGDRLVPAQDAELGEAGQTDVRAEIFRLRNEENRVVGLAGKLSGRPVDGAPDGETTSDWTLVISGRGGLFMTQTNADPVLIGRTERRGTPPELELRDDRGVGATHLISDGEAPDGGRVLGGTGEFTGLAGRYDESWQIDSVSGDDQMQGRIVLRTRIVGGG